MRKVSFRGSCLSSKRILLTFLLLSRLKTQMSLHKAPIEEGIVTVNQTPTRIITLGGWITQPLDKKELVVIISGMVCNANNKIYTSPSTTVIYIQTGNPGLIGYYELFARALYHKLSERYAVWGIGHAGHEIAHNTQVPSIKSIQSSILHRVTHY